MTYSLQRLLLILGLVIIPFYEIFLKALPFVRSVAPDTRAPKEIIAMAFALSIGLVAIFQGKIKPFQNKYLLIIPIYLLFNLIMAPHVDLIINSVESGDFYFWKPFSEVLCFAIMIIAIASMEIDFEYILKVMVICGSVMAGYVVLQKFGFDQFWAVKQPLKWTALISNAQVGGNLGQKTIVASWLVMMVPLAMYLRKWWMMILIITACLLTHSIMSYIAISFIGIIYLIKMNKLFSLILIPIIVLGSIFIYKNKSYVIGRMDGRYQVWKDTLSDIHNGQLSGDTHNFSITGIGLGRFPFIFPDKHKSEFQQAHNDPMEFIYNCGLIGGFLLLGGIYLMFQGALVNMSSRCFFILLSFIAVFICSLGGFPFQLGAHQFYSATLVGLLHNEKLIGRIGNV